ncbi:tRNA preQ1(34) S-adenosylmethionine ribosyltransferase-isomerase QueA [Thalassospira sp.]|uniref:tRNA preQ1(34) S-adenosylmethionine ribosyltransferase-isomerase QueA n=1 Tax=Thalassospira sp. TaxID=1912094 RepID=UPI00273545C2|nr:tRNA preQ1(34) S-adenosylmethionine ribosyltransferase-isomerase QueA [Thalassospira sp.]MDP2696728.1 tRNA preQ1(34) S-adenosylmethionine ribosyltransferase-isomerase QueA [Thalassospira sp.]
MKVDLFDFDLPRDCIAEHPVSPRHNARMLDLTGGAMRDRIVRELPDILRPGDLLISNDTRVIPARLFGKRGDAKIEVTLHKQEGLAQWRAFAKPAKKLRIGEVFRVADDFEAEVMDKQEGGEVLLRFNVAGADLIAALEKYGVMPLPPYIRREAGGDDQDRHDYQTIFAQHDGAVAAPTAGLHFTPELLADLDARGIKRRTITLHVGAGTFLPVKVDDTDDHKMHAEWGSISPEIADLINQTHADGGRVIAVGTTSLRLLESAAREDGVVEPFSAETDIFITPGYRFRVVDVLLTNFHLPKSTLFMLVSAFAGYDRMKAAYAHAIDQKYRFYSYGDCSLLECANKVGKAQ